MNQMTPEELENFIHQQLRGLPPRTAPRTLEARVLAAVEQRAMIPWYHQSLSYWPAPFRIAFLVLATGVTGLVVSGFYFGYSGVDKTFFSAEATEHLGFVTKLYHVGVWIAGLGAQVFASIPTVWVYGTATAIALCYAVFFGLGAAAYRTLYRNN